MNWTSLPLVAMLGCAVSCGGQTANNEKPTVVDESKPAVAPVQTTMEKNPMILMKTSKGDIKIELFADKAPISVKNFLQYVDEKQYNGTIFHRVMNGFMIQGGGFTKDFVQKPTHSPIKNEASNGLKNEVGTLAMARTGDPNSATCQFFINVVNNAGLDYPNPDGHGYAVFGKVVEGLGVVDQIKSVATGNRGPYENVPREPIEIIDVSRCATN